MKLLLFPLLLLLLATATFATPDANAYKKGANSGSWQPGTLKVYVDDIPGASPDGTSAAVDAAIAAWNDLQNWIILDRAEVTKENADIHISWSHVKWGKTSKKDDKDMTTGLRRDRFGKETVRVRINRGRQLNGNAMQAIITHELGHALGLAHSADSHVMKENAFAERAGKTPTIPNLRRVGKPEGGPSATPNDDDKAGLKAIYGAAKDKKSKTDTTTEVVPNGEKTEYHFDVQAATDCGGTPCSENVTAFAVQIPDAVLADGVLTAPAGWTCELKDARVARPEGDDEAPLDDQPRAWSLASCSANPISGIAPGSAAEFTITTAVGPRLVRTYTNSPSWDSDEALVMGPGGSLTGVYDIIGALSLDGTTTSTYVDCIAHIDHDDLTNNLNSEMLCYFDVDLQNAGSVVPVDKERSPGSPGPPYTNDAPVHLTGTYDPVSDTLALSGCLTTKGLLLGTNPVVELTVTGATLNGSVNIWTEQASADCIITPPTPQGPPMLTGDIWLSPPRSGFDFDGDGCTDQDELGVPARPKGCGNDPHNPYDSDDDLSSTSSILITVAPADTCKNGQPSPRCDGQPDGTLAPGLYFHCAASIDHNLATNDLATRLYCYIDSALIEVNPVASPDVFADGLPGSAPPLPFGDLDDHHIELSGAGNFYDPSTNEVHIEGCLDGVDGTLGPNVFLKANYQAHAGIGTVEIWTIRADCTDPGVAAPTFSAALFELAEQGSNKDNAGVDLPSSQHYDRDQDGCSDTNELGPNQTFGGLRDPYNTFDFFDPNGDGAVAFADFLQVLQHFNSNDEQSGAIARDVPPSDPSTETAPGIYSPRYDRGGQITGSNGWNEGPSNGAIGFQDFLSLLRQFGHSCNVNI